MTHWVSLISCWRGTNSSQWRRSLLAIKPRPRYLRQKYWCQLLKLWKEIFKNIEHEICCRLTYPRDVSNFCKNAEDSENMRKKQIPSFSRINCHCKSKWKKVNLKAWSIKKAKYSFNDMVVTCSSFCHQSMDAIFLSKSRKHIYCQRRGGSQEHLQGAALFDLYGVALSKAESSNFMEGITKLYKQYLFNNLFSICVQCS